MPAAPNVGRQTHRGDAIVAAPINYNDSGMDIRVDPTAMFAHATVDMPAEATVVADSINRINDIWQNLALGWVGTTADEAQDFNNRWNGAIVALFGSPAATGSGVLSEIAQAVGVAAINYGEAEDTIRKMFVGLTNGGGTAGPPDRNQNDGPVTENNHP
jgi:uncharacterized protein YukE